jgi:hypothetical protein
MTSTMQTTTLDSGSRREHAPVGHGLDHTLATARRSRRAVLAPFMTVVLALAFWVVAVTEIAAPLGDAVTRLASSAASTAARTAATCEWPAPDSRPRQAERM